MDDFKEILLIGILFILLIAIGAIVLMGIITAVDAGECARLTSLESPHEYKWGLFTGCLVQTEQGYWVDSGNPMLLELEGE